MNHAEAVIGIEVPGALNGPRRVSNADEVGFPLHQKSNRVLAERGQKN